MFVIHTYIHIRSLTSWLCTPYRI